MSGGNYHSSAFVIESGAAACNPMTIEVMVDKISVAVKYNGRKCQPVRTVPGTSVAELINSFIWEHNLDKFVVLTWEATSPYRQMAHEERFEVEKQYMILCRYGKCDHYFPRRFSHVCFTEQMHI
jgi:hypothetical protein